jgi:hypothetical protein
MAVIADLLEELASTAVATLLDVLMIVGFLLVFQRVVLGQKPLHPGSLAVGFIMIVVGLTLLLLGLDKALFPVGRLMVEQLTTVNAVAGATEPQHWTQYYPVYGFAFAIAFGAALAEPALLAISRRVNEITGGAVRAGGLRVVAALGVACGVTLGCVRIVAGIPLHWCIAVIALIILIQTLFAPRTIVPLAYDAGGVSTTAVTVPVVIALGLGLAEQLPGRTPLIDGFGLIALACLMPAVTVLAYAQISWLVERIQDLRLTAAGRKRLRDKEK